jgi:hypothetical protein
MLHLLRHEVLGPAVFDRAFRDYTRTWAFRHPTPADFFRLMRDASGAELDWYWREWIYTTARLDQAIDSVGQSGDSVHVYLSNRGAMVMPAELRLRFASGKEETVRLPVDMWNLGDRFTYSARVPARVSSVTLDPREVLPDVDRGNNSK